MSTGAECNGLKGAELSLVPGPHFHAGHFKERTILEVHRVVKCLHDLQKETDQNASSELLFEALEELADLCVDRDVLEKTSVGKEVKKMQKQHADPLVCQRAGALCEQWRRDYDVRKKVVDGFVEKGTLNKRDAKELEEGLFNQSCPLGILEGDGYESYKKQYKRLCSHLRTRGQGSLVQRIQDSSVDTSMVMLLSDSELMSCDQRQQQEQVKREAMRQAVTGSCEAEGGTITDEHTCPKCEATRTSYVEVPTGWHKDHQDMTIIVRCLQCGERWKSNDDHGLAGS